MHRRAQAVLAVVATSMGILAVAVAIVIDRPLVDPDGFLGPSWFRLPAMFIAALAVDLLPRALWQSRGRRSLIVPLIRDRLRTHWTRDRLMLVSVGLVSFYVTYVSYRNLKSFLPLVLGLDKYDRALHLMDQWLFFGVEPATVVHAVFGTTISAHVLSAIYLWFLPLVPLTLLAWLVWAREISYGYWFVIGQVLAWTFGTASYYLLPTQGPGFRYVWLYEGLASTPTTDLMNTLAASRNKVVLSGFEDTVQSVAGFASLHCAITLLFALMAQYTVRQVWVRWVVWINFGITIVATLYFGWHYVADDIAGIVIALAAFRIGAWATQEEFAWRKPPDREVTRV
ncbi:MAG: phosphatase PAP2 family protein [Nocardioides sp.]